MSSIKNLRIINEQKKLARAAKKAGRDVGVVEVIAPSGQRIMIHEGETIKDAVWMLGMMGASFEDIPQIAVGGAWLGNKAANS